MQMDIPVLSQERFDGLRLVGRQVVGDDVDLAPFGLARDDLAQECDEFRTRVPRDRFSHHLAGVGIQRGEERQRAVAVVLEAVTFDSPRREWENRNQAIQRLNRRLLVHTENCGVLRRLHVEADDVGRLGLEVRIVRRHVALDPMRLETGALPDARETRARDSAFARPAIAVAEGPA